MAGKSSKWMKMVRKEQMDEVLEEAETGAQQSEESARPRTGRAGKGFSPKDVGGTDIIQESQLWAMGKGPKLPKNNIEKTLSWSNRHTQAVSRLRPEREPRNNKFQARLR